MKENSRVSIVSAGVGALIGAVATFAIVSFGGVATKVVELPIGAVAAIWNADENEAYELFRRTDVRMEGSILRRGETEGEQPSWAGENTTVLLGDPYGGASIWITLELSRGAINDQGSVENYVGRAVSVRCSRPAVFDPSTFSGAGSTAAGSFTSCEVEG